jgi:hypothetical protein
MSTRLTTAEEADNILECKLPPWSDALRAMVLLRLIDQIEVAVAARIALMRALDDWCESLRPGGGAGLVVR